MTNFSTNGHHGSIAQLIENKIYDWTGEIMDMQNVLRSLAYFVRDIILRPVNIFRKIENGDIQNEVFLVFAVSCLVTLFKSFLTRRNVFNFFADERLNQIVSIFSANQIRWLVIYIAYFAMIYSVFVICRLFGREQSLKPLMLALMSISGVGIVSQVFFYPLHLVLPKNIILIGSYVVYLWVTGLSIRAIQMTQGLSFLKAIASFLPPAIIFITICGMAVISPYLAWLTV